MGASNMRLISQADEEGHYMRRHNGMAGKPRKGCKDMWNAFIMSRMASGLTTRSSRRHLCRKAVLPDPLGPCMR